MQELHAQLAGDSNVLHARTAHVIIALVVQLHAVRSQGGASASNVATVNCFSPMTSCSIDLLTFSHNSNSKPKTAKLDGVIRGVVVNAEG